MSAFVDASVLVAIMAEEEDDRYWLDRLRGETNPMTSPIVVWETVRATARVSKTPVVEVSRQLSLLLSSFGVTVVTVGNAESKAAPEAHQRYGKGNHPAKLNMGDCFAYACARENQASLLYKGDDFAQTDLA